MNPFFEVEPIHVDRPTPCYWDPELWFSNEPEDVFEAKRLCSNCDIRTRCLGDAIANNEAWGIWGGLTAQERDGDIDTTDAIPNERYTDPTGTVRRMQALACNGYTQEEISVLLGLTPNAAKNYLRLDTLGKRITVRSARRIAAVYNELRHQRGSSEVASRRAFRKGWQPPEAWTAATIDDPDALPLDIDQIGA